MRLECKLATASVLALGIAACASQRAVAQQPAAKQPETAEATEEPWLKPYPIPADPELEQQINEVQEALTSIHQQIVRRKEALKKAADPAAKSQVYDELEVLRKEAAELERLLHELVEEARASERTAIDEALARARWLERQQEYQAQKEEIIRDRQQ